MRIFYSPKFKPSLKKFPKEIRDKFYKQTIFLLKDIRYPSLQVKKYDKSRRIWQARVDRNIRFYFLIEKDIYYILYIKHHPK